MKLFSSELANNFVERYILPPFLFIAVLVCSLYGGIIWNGNYGVQIAFLVMSVLFAVYAFFARRRERFAKLPKLGMEWMIAFSLLVIISSWILSPLPRQGIWRIASIIGYFALLYVLTDLFANGFNARLLFNIIMIVVGLYLFSALLETYLAYQGWFSTVASYKIFPPTIYRFTSLLGHSNALMAAANLLAPVALIFFFQQKKFVSKFFYLLWFVLFGMSLIFCSSRGSYAGMFIWIVILLGYFLFFHSNTYIQKHRKLLVIILVLLGICFIVAFLIFGQFLLTHPTHGTGLFSTRENMWTDALKIWKHHMWFGAGPGRIPFEILNVDSAIPPQYFPNHVHSTWLQILAEFGVMGFIAFLLVNYRGIKSLISQWKALEESQKLLGMAFLASFGGFFIQSILDDFSQWVFIIFIFISLLAMYMTLLPEKVKIWREVNVRAIFIPIGILVAAGIYSIWAQAPFRQGVQAYEQSNYEVAAQTITDSIQRDKYSSFLYTEAGLAWSKVWIETGDQTALRKARQYLLNSASLEDSPSFLWADLAVLEWYSGDHQKGLQYIQHAIEINDAEPSHYLMYGYFLELMNNNTEANLVYRRVVDMLPDTCSNPFWRGTKLRENYACDINGDFVIKRDSSGYLKQAAAYIASSEFHQAQIAIQKAKWIGADAVAIDMLQYRLAEAQGQTENAKSIQASIIQNDLVFNNYVSNSTFQLVISRLIYRTKGIGYILVPGYMQVTPDFGQYELAETYLTTSESDLTPAEKQSLNDLIFRANHAGALPSSIE